MAEHNVRFTGAGKIVVVPTGTLLAEAARLAGLDLSQPCGGQGRCGRCAVLVVDGAIRRRSTLRLSPADVQEGFALACQSVVEGDVTITIPPQEKVERRLTTDRTVGEVVTPEGYDHLQDQNIHRIPLTLMPPSMDDQTDDWSRLQTALRKNLPWDSPDSGETLFHISLPLLRNLGSMLREAEWEVTAVVDRGSWDCQGCPPRVIGLIPGLVPEETPLWGAAIDIGTTTVTVWLVDLISGKVTAQVAEYNQQITRGEDVISRIIYASKNNGGQELQSLVLETINTLLDRACKRTRSRPDEIFKAALAGNSVMMHLLLGVPPESIRLTPFITAVNHVPAFAARDIGLQINPDAPVDCLPGVASYVGADISAGVLSSRLDESEKVSLFLDVGTNGETVMGSRDWLITCACSAGPAFEGAGVEHGMRATKGAIEEVWVNGATFEPTYRVIGGVKPRGICGSGLISLLAELFLTGVLDKGGNFNTSLGTERIRSGQHGMEYVVVWGSDAHDGKDIALTRVDVDNLVRAKAAIYAGFTVLADKVGLPLETVEQVLVGGSFGKYINVEKAVEIGLLPDMPWENFHFLGNTSVRGAYLALLDRQARSQIEDIASRMTYIELSADNAFFEAFTSASFLPHTDLSRFPSVARELEQTRKKQQVQ